MRAILGLPIPTINYRRPSASAVILADREAARVDYAALDRALALANTDVRSFRKPDSRKYRRMGVALATAKDAKAARALAKKAASRVKLVHTIAPS